MSTPLVTVVVTVYHRTTYLREAIERALGQTYRELEILVVNDAGATEIDSIVASYPDPRLRYLRHPENLGLPQSFLQAFAEARGSLLVFLNDDDSWEPEFVARMVAALAAHAEASIAFCDHFVINVASQIDLPATEANSRHWGRANLAPGIHRPFRDLVVRGTVPSCMAAVFRKEAVAWDDYPAAVGMCYDLWLSYLLAREGRAAVYVPERLTRYRVHEDTLTSTGRTTRAASEAYIFDRILADERFATERPKLRLLRARVDANRGYDLLQQGQTCEARAALSAAWLILREPKIAVSLALSYLPARLLQPALQAWRRRGAAATPPTETA